MPFTNDPEHNLRILEAMVEEFEDYLASDELFRQLVVQTPERTLMPKMTVGLMREHVDALEREFVHMLPTTRNRITAAIRRFESVRDANLAAYAEKLRRELKGHLDSWSWYLKGCLEGDDECADNYPRETWIRTRLDELFLEASSLGVDVADATQRLHELDQQLDNIFERGAYVGPADTEAEYPADRYWWLYGRPSRRP
jgi:hypothetical protein